MTEDGQPVMVVKLLAMDGTDSTTIKFNLPGSVDEQQATDQIRAQGSGDPRERSRHEGTSPEMVGRVKADCGEAEASTDVPPPSGGLRRPSVGRRARQGSPARATFHAHAAQRPAPPEVGGVHSQSRRLKIAYRLRHVSIIRPRAKG